MLHLQSRAARMAAGGHAPSRHSLLAQRAKKVRGKRMRWAHCPAAWPQLLVVHETAAAVLAQRPAVPCWIRSAAALKRECQGLFLERMGRSEKSWEQGWEHEGPSRPLGCKPSVVVPVPVGNVGFALVETLVAAAAAAAAAPAPAGNVGFALVEPLQVQIYPGEHPHKQGIPADRRLNQTGYYSLEIRSDNLLKVHTNAVAAA
eukprot:1148241-Pelagomonas_calceolata.AAC.2